jgi:hypothetical protein
MGANGIIYRPKIKDFKGITLEKNVLGLEIPIANSF